MKGAIVRAMVCLVFVFFAASSQSATVLLLSSGNGTQDASLAGILEDNGHSVVLGPQSSGFSASTELSGIQAVILQANYNWTEAYMSADGQAALLRFIRDGGGLVTTEWVVWLHSGQNRFLTLYDAIPVLPDPVYRNDGAITYTQAASDPLLNAGLPVEFTFTAENIGGTETRIAAKPGATVFYGSDYADGEGLIGWDFGIGRVVSFSTLVAGASLADENYARLVSNAVDWAAFNLVFRDRFEE